MSQGILEEIRLFFHCLLLGVGMMALYDGFRILRRVIRHSAMVIALEDAVYWILASIFIFQMMYRENHGAIRGFSILSVTFGMLLYHQTVSAWVVRYLSRLFLFLRKPLDVVAGIFRKIARKSRKKLQKSVKELIMSLLS